MRRVCLNALLIATVLGACQNSRAPADRIRLPGAGATELRIQAQPFQLCVGDTLCTAQPSATAAAGPQPWSYAEGPRPQINPQTAAAFPAFGWVVGQTENEVIPTFIWQGNRLSGRDTGLLYEVTAVAQVVEHADHLELLLDTNYNGNAAPARLRLRTLPSGAVQARLTPPAGMADEGIALTLFSLESPADEGLFGMGARKDFFNQRGRLRNVWTEQQNTGLGALDELDLTGVGAFGGAPIPTTNPTTDIFDATGLNPDLDDALLLEERTSFPNGAQAAYWVEAYVVGARGWAAWTDESHFQRIDLAATAPDRIRWQIVDSDVLTLNLADGQALAADGESPIEAASRAYTANRGRAPAPTTVAYEPWIDTLNQGEGEAAPNGQGFWGGQRARCEVQGFIDKSQFYDLPFGLIGIEGWHVLPQTPTACLTLPHAAICEEPGGFPRNEEQLRAEFDAGTSFLNRAPGCSAAGTYFDEVRTAGFEIAGYWNFFTTNHGCPDHDPAQCVDDQLGVPLASKQAYEEAYNRDLFIKSSPSASEDQTDDNGNHVVTTNRGGLASLIDFTKPGAVDYWQRQLARSLDLGITIFMHDFGELTTDAMVLAEGENLTESHNLFAFRYQQAARLAIENYRADRGLGNEFAPYFYARAGMTGACAFTPGVFPGDESTSWDAGHGLPSVMPAMLNLALSGCYAFSTDVGGYFDVTAPRTSEDLFIRWSQLAALTPVMRIHDSTFNGSVFPWTWSPGEELAAEDNPAWDTVAIFRRYARLKQNLIPLTDHWAQRAATQGDIGPVRPLILIDNSPAAQVQDYQWLYGDDLLVAPVFEEDQAEVPVYFPAGNRWAQVVVDAEGRLLPTGTVFDGGAVQDVPVDTAGLADIPLFLRCGGAYELLPVSGVVRCEVS